MHDWRYTDPRSEINKRAKIIILKPEQGSNWEAGTGFVDTKDGWYIDTSFDRQFSENDEWDQDWCWTWAPKRKV